jgi:hypothetical protein
VLPRASSRRTRHDDPVHSIPFATASPFPTTSVHDRGSTGTHRFEQRHRQALAAHDDKTNRSAAAIRSATSDRAPMQMHTIVQAECSVCAVSSSPSGPSSRDREMKTRRFGLGERESNVFCAFCHVRLPTFQRERRVVWNPELPAQRLTRAGVRCR